MKRIPDLLIVFFLIFLTGSELFAGAIDSGIAGNNFAGNSFAGEKLTFRYDNNRSGYTHEKISPPLTLNWFFNTNSNDDYIFKPRVYSSIVGEGNTLYFGSNKNFFCAFDAEKKAYLWRFETNGAVESGATISGEKILFGDSKGYLYCVDKNSGKIIWQNSFKLEIISSPLIVGDKVFFSDMSDSLYCVFLDTGKLVWKKEIESYLRNIIIRGTASPSYSGGLVYQGFSDGYLYSFDAETFKERFRKKVKAENLLNDVDAPAAVDGDTVYVSSFDGNFAAIDSKEPESKWELKIKGNGYPAFNEDALIIAAADGALYRVDKKIGNVIWETKLSANLTAPVINDDYVFVASEDYLYVVDIKSGRVAYEYEPGSGISSEPYIYGGYVYFISNKGYLYCFKSK